jgi:LacI family transcriptional regulator
MTIKDVAKEAQVSVATVSRVINGFPNVNDELRVRVEQTIEKLGFKPNQLAKGLLLTRWGLLYLIYPILILTG